MLSPYVPEIHLRNLFLYLDYNFEMYSRKIVSLIAGEGKTLSIQERN